jgi:methylmalonyl-CoA/ethylmalonyl-CoA epimerase
MTLDPDPSVTTAGFAGDHVGVAVAHLDLSLAFYQGVLGFRCEKTIDLPDGRGRVALLVVPGLTIEMFALPEARRLPDDRRTPATDLQTIGVKHFALRVDDIEAAASHLRRNGVGFITEVAVGVRGRRRFFVMDPDGIAIEVTE